MADIWTTTAIAGSGIATGTPAAAAVEHRSDIMQMTQTSEDAVLRPAAPGAWPHALRAALACRVARLNGSDNLGQHYLSKVDASEYAVVTDPLISDAIPELAPCLTFVDRVATQPRDITAEDIRILQDAAVSDADIVRLTELVAFLAYQIRLVEGLRLLAGDRS